jgi:hypothetical protein
MSEARAIAPFHVNAHGWVVDATGSRVLVCAGWCAGDMDCPLRFNEREVDADGHFICPNCGRLGQRMVEATPEQCGLTANQINEHAERQLAATDKSTS